MIVCPVCEHAQPHGSECEVCGKRFSPSIAGAAPGPAVPAMEGLEPTRFAPVSAPVAPVPDLEPTLAAPVDEATPTPAAPVCRYCRTPAGPGERRCGRCGMRLPVPVARAGGPAEGQAPALCSCGAPAAGPTCPACGARRIGRGG